MTTKLLCIFTRTPLHVGAGASVGAIDQPIQRERHTGFPIIPASSLKGSFADQWPATHEHKEGKRRLATETLDKDGRKTTILKSADVAAWLFGSDTTDLSFAGSLLFSEARLLAFPIRSARGSYAWITCPLMLQRAVRDGVIDNTIPPEPKDDEAIFKEAGPLALGSEVEGRKRYQVVLEDYCFTHTDSYPNELADALAGLVPGDRLFASIAERLVILSNGMMSHFATTACEVAQHVRISDETGTAEGTGLFNQENVPADTLFYSVLRSTPGRSDHFKKKSADDAVAEFEAKLHAARHVFQFGGDASTGLGFCSVVLNQPCNL
jgi:CRISPR-associated protein Cmr4